MGTQTEDCGPIASHNSSHIQWGTDCRPYPSTSDQDLTALKGTISLIYGSLNVCGHYHNDVCHEGYKDVCPRHVCPPSQG
jgi:hypothetical protein